MNRDRLFGNSGVRDMQGVRVGLITCNSRIDPYLKLQNILKSTTSYRTVVMGSSYPCDYHVRLMCDDYYLIKSYSGAEMKPIDLPEYVFSDKYKDVPFFPCTHDQFGDKPLILPKLKPKEKKKITETAAFQRWSSMPESLVKDKLRFELQN